MFKKYLFSLFKDAADGLVSNILKSTEEDSSATFLDYGCDEGDITMAVAKCIKTQKIYGIDIIEERFLKAGEKGIIVKNCDLNGLLPFGDDSIGVVHANQVIEHLWNLDMFCQELLRILKPGGYAIISTENLSSWHNIFSLILGFQPFSSTNVSQLGIIGNPFALHRLSGKKEGSLKHFKPFAHLILLSYQGLKELFEAHHFKVEKILGAGYYPFPKYISKILSQIDKRHAAFLTIKVRKQEKQK